MTDFFTRCCRKLSLGLAVLGFVAAHAASAAGIVVEHAELVPADDTYHLNANFNIEFSSEVEEAISKGVALNFLVEFVLMEPHKYWFDEEVSSASRMIKLSYHALSRQYLINIGSHQMTFSSLQEAEQALGKLQDWPVVEKATVKKGTPYYAMLRMRLDHGSLPKPLQVSALGSDKWDLLSERYRWTPFPDKSTPQDKTSSDK
jgi:hypothetical protein